MSMNGTLKSLKLEPLKSSVVKMNSDDWTRMARFILGEGIICYAVEPCLDPDLLWCLIESSEMTAAILNKEFEVEDAHEHRLYVSRATTHVVESRAGTVRRSDELSEELLATFTQYLA